LLSTLDTGARKAIALAAPHKCVSHHKPMMRMNPVSSTLLPWPARSILIPITASTLQPSRSGRDHRASDKLAAQRSYLYFYISSVMKSNKLTTVNEKQEAARQRAELKWLRAECQKLKAMKQAVPGSDEEDEDELNERPNTTV
jgi:hypothetical protein